MHELFACDRLFLVEVLRQLIELRAVLGEDVHSLFVLRFHQLHDALVDLRLRFGGAGERRIAAKILVRHRFERDHVEIIAHAVARDHRAGELGRLLNIVRRAGRDGVEHDLLRGAAAGQRGDLVLHFGLAHQVMVALFDLHRVAQCARGARHNGDLLHGGGVRLHRRHERVADLVVGDDLLLLVGHDGVLLLVARDDDLDAFL